MNDELYVKVLDEVLRLEVFKGHQKWTVAQLARGSGVKRPLIYYYFGKSKMMIIQTAIRMLGEEFFGLSSERMKLWNDGDILSSITRTRELLEKAPHVRVFYFHWRHRESPIQEELIEIERKYIRKLQNSQTKLLKPQAEAVFAVLFGLCQTPSLARESLELVIDMLQRGHLLPAAKSSTTLKF